MENQPWRIAILASGAGSNARNLISYFDRSDLVEIVLVASNKATAGVLDMAREHGIATSLLHRSYFYESDGFLQELHRRQVNFIVLAGFLLKIPGSLVNAFPHRIVNIHPALLPAYGGKGMYGHFVHEAVHMAREKESGITVHFVDENYDEGDIIFQARVALSGDDTPESIERKVRALEIMHFPRVVEELLKGMNKDQQYV